MQERSSAVMHGSELLSLWIVSRRTVIWVPVAASTLVMRAAPSSASAGILESASTGSCGHLLLALITMLVVLSWLWPAVTFFLAVASCDFS